MVEDPIKRPEFKKLQEHLGWLRRNLNEHKITRAKLLEIMDHIRLCDYIIPDEVEKALIKTTKCVWDIAAQTIREDDSDLQLYNVGPQPPLTTALQIIHKDDTGPCKIEYLLTANDVRYLKALKIKPEQNSPPEIQKNLTFEERLTEQDKRFLRRLYKLDNDIGENQSD
jgi:hypothetical protein